MSHKEPTLPPSHKIEPEKPWPPPPPLTKQVPKCTIKTIHSIEVDEFCDASYEEGAGNPLTLSGIDHQSIMIDELGAVKLYEFLKKVLKK